jgi:predicted Zn-dependent protease
MGQSSEETPLKKTARLALSLALLLLCSAGVDAAPRAVAVPAGAGVRAGAVYRDAGLAAYVDGVGRRLVGAARAGGDWRFVVIDDPEANAFALPGSRVLVTRGMLALAGDEAEVAAVIAHEIAHVLAGHARAGAGHRGPIEVEADRIGLRLLAAAGYDPRAQGDLQATLIAAHALDARLRGAPAPLPARAYAPALDDRLRASRAAAARSAGGVRGRARHLAAIDGIAWGSRSAGLRIRLHRIGPRDDVRAIASAMPVGNASRARFDLLNGLGPGGSLRVGDVVKLVGR